MRGYRVAEGEDAMTALGPKAEAALKDGPKTNGESILDSTIVATYCETPEAFARRVALIAVEEERERCAQVAVEAQRFCTDYCDSAAAAIRDGR